jgi:hypothetical protein
VDDLFVHCRLISAGLIPLPIPYGIEACACTLRRSRYKKISRSLVLVTSSENHQPLMLAKVPASRAEGLHDCYWVSFPDDVKLVLDKVLYLDLDSWGWSWKLFWRRDRQMNPTWFLTPPIFRRCCGGLAFSLRKELGPIHLMHNSTLITSYAGAKKARE